MMRFFQRKKRAAESQLDSELAFHIDKLVEEKIAVGLPPEQARREAVLEFGGAEQVKEELRDVYRIATLESVVTNLKLGIRLMKKSPTFSATVILTLGLGIGANSAVFSAINAILLRPLPFPNSDELMIMHQKDRTARNPESFVAPVRLEDWNRLNSTFQTISGWYGSDVSETSGLLPEKLTEALVAPRFVQVLGVSPAIGRDFTSEEERFGGPNAILISDRYWRRRFQADPNVIGKILRVEKHSTQIVGVMRASFTFPDEDVDIWTTSPADAPYAQDRQSTWFTAIGRLKAGVTPGEGRADLAHVQAQLGRQFPKTDANLDPSMQPLKETTVSGARRSLWVLYGAVSLLLLIACTNIAALLLARTSEREREISVRFSLGASRGSIIVQLLTECFVLALAGSALGLILAAVGSNALRNLAKGLPRAGEISMDWRILIYTLGCSVAATLLCGLVPAIRGTREGIAGELSRGSRSQVSIRNPLQWTLVGIQVTLAVTLLMGAGLLLRSFEELGRVSPGFDVSHVLILRISGNWGETVDMKALTAHMNRTIAELAAVPGVSSAATAADLPGIHGRDSQTEIKLLEGSTGSGDKIFADSRFVSTGYFATMRIPLLGGKECTESLNTFDSVVVNRSFVNKYMNSESSIGRHLQLVSSQFLPSPARIQGIVGDARELGLSQEPGPTVYWCVSAPTPTPYFLIRTQGDPMAMAETLRRRVRDIDPARSVYDVSRLENQLSDSFAENRLRTVLLSLFALTAVSLACVGVYGTLSYFVAVRRREVGLRLALGAMRSQIVMRFFRMGLGVAFIGCVAGSCLGVVSARILSGMLYGVTNSDSETLWSVVLMMLSVAGVASLVPALRAARVEPMRVLRDE